MILSFSLTTLTLKIINMEKHSTLFLKILIGALFLSPSSLLWAQFEFQQKIVGERESRAEFGTSISVHNSYMAVGASRENIAAGAAYVYQYNGSSWELMQKLVPADSQEMAEFGGGIKLGSDYLVVASGRADIAGQIRAGALYVYDLNDAHQWTFNTKLIASDFSEDSMLGMNPTSLDVEGNTIVVGAPGENNWIGSVYVFEKINEIWSEVQKITPPQSIEYSNFGIGVALSGNHLIIGASGENEGRGAVYVYEKNNSGNWEFFQKLTASTPQPNSYFGNSISAHNNQFVAGAYAEGNPGTDFASVYIFEKTGNTWSESQKLVGNSSDEDNYYGWMTKITADNLWVSSPHIWGMEPGKIHHYQKDSNGIWMEAQLIEPSENVAEDSFGWSMDFNDGFLAVGAVRDDFDQNGENELMDAGSAFVFFNANLQVESLNPTENWVQIFPNPVKNILHLETSEKIKSANIYDTTGRLIISSSEKSIEISNLPKGVYFLKITNFSGRISSHKLIKN
jgi:hypothetical protein